MNPVLLVSYDLPAETRRNFPKFTRQKAVRAYKTKCNTLRNGFRNKLVNEFGAELVGYSLLMIRDVSDDTIRGVRIVVAVFTQRYRSVGLTPHIKMWKAVVLK